MATRRSAPLWCLLMVRRRTPTSAAPAWTAAGLLAIIVPLLVALLAVRSGAAVVAIACPATPPAQGDQFISEVSIDVGTTPLGAYTVEITYDKNVVTIASVAGGTTPEFSGPPVTNSADFTSGRTRISAFNSASVTAPTGVVSVARVTFNAVGTAGSSTDLGLTVITIADTGGNPIPRSTAGCSVSIVAAGPTATETPTPIATFTPLVTFTSSPTPTATFAATPTLPRTVTSTPTVTSTSAPTLSVTPAPTLTFTRASTFTFTPAQTPTHTSTFGPTSTFTFSPTASPTSTLTPPLTPTFTFTQSLTPTPTFTLSATATVPFTATPTGTATATLTLTPTATQTLTATSTFTVTPTPTPTDTFVVTATPVLTFTSTPTVSPTLTSSAAPTATQSLTARPTFTFTLTPTPTNTFVLTATPAFTSTSIPTGTATLTFTATPTATQSMTATPTFTATPTRPFAPTATSTFTPTPTVTPPPTRTPTVTATHAPTATATRVALGMEQPMVSPDVIIIGQATALLVTTRAVDPSFVPLSVNLLRVDNTGRVIAIVGAMHDDGTDGDAIAQDGVFTLQFTVTEPAAGELRLVASAAFPRALRRVLSPMAVVPVVAASDG